MDPCPSRIETSYTIRPYPSTSQSNMSVLAQPSTFSRGDNFFPGEWEASRSTDDFLSRSDSNSFKLPPIRQVLSSLPQDFQPCLLTCTRCSPKSTCPTRMSVKGHRPTDVAASLSCHPITLLRPRLKGEESKMKPRRNR